MKIPSTQLWENGKSKQCNNSQVYNTNFTPAQFIVAFQKFKSKRMNIGTQTIKKKLPLQPYWGRIQTTRTPKTQQTPYRKLKSGVTKLPGRGGGLGLGDYNENKPWDTTHLWPKMLHMHFNTKRHSVLTHCKNIPTIITEAKKSQRYNILICTVPHRVTTLTSRIQDPKLETKHSKRWTLDKWGWVQGVIGGGCEGL